MSRRYQIMYEIEMPDGSTVEDAETWGICHLECAFKKRNPVPRQFGEFGYEAEIPMPPSEHPYRPRFIKATEVAQPRPRKE